MVMVSYHTHVLIMSSTIDAGLTLASCPTAAPTRCHRLEFMARHGRRRRRSRMVPVSYTCPSSGPMFQLRVSMSTLLTSLLFYPRYWYSELHDSMYDIFISFPYYFPLFAPNTPFFPRAPAASTTST